MASYVYLYKSPGYSPGHVYSDFPRALAQLLKDEGYSTLEAFGDALREQGVWHEFALEHEEVSVDDGPSISKLEVL